MLSNRLFFTNFFTNYVNSLKQDITYKNQIDYLDELLFGGGLYLKKNKINKPLVFLHICIYITQLTLINIVAIRNFSLLSLITTVECSSPVIFASIKGAALCLRFHDVQGIISDINTRIWDIQKTAPNEETRRDCQELLNVFKYYKVFLKSLVGCIVLVFFLPLIFGRGDQIIPFEVYRPEPIPPIAIWIFQLYMSYCIYAYSLGFDAFIFISVMQLLVQFKLINNRLKAINFERDDPLLIKATVKMSIDHHNWILGVVKDINGCASAANLLLFMVEAFGISMELYAVSSATVPVLVIIRAMLFAYSIFFQFFIFCFLSDTLQGEAYKICYSIYSSNWYTSRNPKIIKDLIPIMAMSSTNNNVKLKGWKLLDLDLPAFIMVTKSSMSYYTLLKTFSDF